MQTHRAIVMGWGLVATVAMATSPGLSLRGKAWQLTLDLSTFSLATDESNTDGSARKALFSNKDDRINLTVVMKPVNSYATVVAIRDERLRRLQEIAPPEEAVRSWTDEHRAYFEYFTETPVQGGPLHQKHIHTFIVHDGIRIEVHVSVTRFEERDQGWLDSFQRSIGIRQELAVKADSTSEAVSTRLVSSPDGTFAFIAPDGWTVQRSEGELRFMTLARGDERIALTFHPSRPGKWTVDTLMAVQDEGARASFGDVVPTEKQDLNVPGGPGALWVYRLRDAPSGVPYPFTGCAILRNGGVGVLGVAFEKETLEAVREVVHSIRAKAGDE